MEFEIEQPKFLSTLSLAQTVADRRATMPVLANVLMSVNKAGELVCSATDMTISVTETTPVTAHAAGSLCLGVRHLHGVVRTLPDRPVKVKGLDNHWAQLTVGRNEFKLMGMSEEDFPQLPDPGGLSFTRVPGQKLVDLIQKTQFSVSTDEARINLNGVLFECDGKQATMVSTDGHRLTKMTCDFAGPQLERGVIVPRKGVLEIRRVLERAEGEVDLALDDQHLFLRVGAVTVSVKLSDVTFPPYEQVIPRTHTRRATALREELASVLRRAEVMAPEKTATVRLALKEGGLEVTADNPDLGVAHQEIEVDYDGDPLVAGFNARYLIEVLEAMDVNQVHLEFQGELDPCVLRPVDGADYLGVVMPMRI